ncbi:hypothetical protein Stsp02_31230 [Streptomyces sp. NBRC 14336]|uniref:hypothetical protein n=1 Tax=Streptomyces TaxID=1883 RepID=UPI0024A187A6|nr:hypothetical protein [Streptomyces sp. NBRC 14336]GLW47461.1 hypothetical protein Stsp02_31230 [Streptomyces sp. NBRC 14336]
MVPRPHRSSEPTAAEASAWADVLVRRRLLHAAVLVPTGHWLIQDRPDGPVRVLGGATDVVALAATIQHHTRTVRPEIR